jgi:hypothetical protein
MVYLALAFIVTAQFIRYLTTIGDQPTHIQASADLGICLLIFLSYQTQRLIKKGNS